MIAPQYVADTHGEDCGGLSASGHRGKEGGVKLTTAFGTRLFCCGGCPLYEVFLRLYALDQRGEEPCDDR